MNREMNHPKWLRLALPVIGALGMLLIIGGLLSLSIAPAQTAAGLPDLAGLQVDKVGPVTATAGTFVDYTILVTNSTASTLNGVIITDTWNSQDYDGNYQQAGSVAVNSMTLITNPVRYAQFNLNPLPPNATGRLTITMWISPNLRPRYGPSTPPVVLGNSVVITTSTPGVTGSNDNVDTSIVGPLLVLTKSYTPTTYTPRPGQLLTYTFKLENKYRSDAIPATGVVITEQLPTNMLFYAAYPLGLATYNEETNWVQWNLAETIPVSAATYVTLTVRISPTTPYGNINNSHNNCGVYAYAIPWPIMCATDVSVNLNDTFEKFATTISPPAQSGAISKTFPNRIMTYTIFVYNPFPSTVTGMLVTDTMPNFNFSPTQTFQYQGLVSSSPPGLPTEFSISQKYTIWQMPDLNPESVYTFTFRAFVPPQMRIDDNGTQREYRNIVEGSYGGLKLAGNYGDHDNPMKVLVVPQIVINKIVTPTQQMYGLPVTYTLILSNSGPTTIRDIALADILPTNGSCGFEWDSLVSGLPPTVSGFNTVSWPGITLTAYAQTTVAVFRATVFGFPGATCANTVQGYSPDTYIVKMTNLAPVRVDVPFRYTKSAAPLSVILGGSIQYDVSQYNIGPTPAMMTYFKDTLPSGFFNNGSTFYSQTVNMILEPNTGNVYEAVFPVDVLWTPEPCDNLPKSIPQRAGSFGMYISSPPDLSGFWVNAGDAGAVTVYPQATATKSSVPANGLPGDVLTFTISLSNNTSLPWTSLRVTDTLPAGFTFGASLPGTDPPFAIQGQNVIWDNQSIPGGGKSTLVFTVTAASPVNDTNYNNIVKAGSLSDPLLCVPKNTLPILVRLGRFEINKTASPTSISPLGQFDYQIELRNKGPYTVTMSRFTETLPGVGGYPWKYVGMTSGPTPVSTDPLVWTNLTVGQDKTQILKFTVRAGSQVGTFKNFITPLPTAGYMTGTLPSRWFITVPNNYLGSPVTVIPGMGVGKDVYPDIVDAGNTIVYTITLVNVSGTSVTNLRITDTLPTSFTFDSYVGGVVPIGTNPPIWTIASMSNGTQQYMAFKVRVPANKPSGLYYNKRVQVTANNISIAPLDNSAPVRVNGVPNVLLSKTVYPTATFYGGTTAYTITLINEGIEPLTVRVTDTLPPGFSFVSPIGTTPFPDSATPLVWNNITLTGTETRDLGFVVFVANTAPTGIVYNQIDASSQNYVFQGTGPTAPVLVKAQPTYDLQITKSGTPGYVQVGDLVTYTIVYQNVNDDNMPLTNIVVTDTFPSAGVSVIDAPGWVEVQPGMWTLNVGALDPNQSGVATLVLQVDQAPDNNVLINNVAVNGQPPANAIESNPGNNQATAITFVGVLPSVAIDKTVSPTLAFTGDVVTYSLSLRNDSAVTLTLRVTDTMPAGFVFNSVVGATPAPASTSPLVWTNLAVGPGQSMTLSWRATVGAGTPPGFYYNTVNLDANGVPLPGRNDLAQIETDVRRYYALKISKTDGQRTATPGSTLNYTIRYTNTSTNVTLTQVTLTDLFSPTDVLTFLSPSWNLSGTGTYTRAVADLPPGGSGSVVVQMQLAATLPPDLLSISNKAMIDAVPAVRATELITSTRSAIDFDIVSGADLAVINLTVVPARVRNGGTITAVVTVMNQGFTATLGPDGTGWFGVDLYVKPAGEAAPTGPDDRYYGLCPTPTDFCPGAQRGALYQYIQSNGGRGLNVGETKVLTYTYKVPDPILPTSGTLQIFAQADTYLGQPGTTIYGTPDHGRILEGDELNNIGGPVEIYLNPSVYLPLLRK